MKKKSFFVSIIITNFNKEKYIYQTIKSALNQKYKKFEIIVIDNFSSDNSYEIISKFRNIKLLFNKQKKTGALNQIKSIEIGLKNCRGNIVCLLDGDDLFNKNKVSQIVNFFNKNPNCDAVLDLPIIFENINKPINFSYDKKRETKSSIWPTTFPTSTISIRKNYLKKCIQVFKKNNFQNLEIDFRLCCLFSITENNYNILNKKLTYYRQVNDGIMSNYKKFRKRWWIKRSEAFNFFFYFKKKYKRQYSYSLDFFVTKIISKILQ
tara:strand:- start:1393 stop:2187 length:795 start_codon:yes stop_codon:yes gene_type:complete